MALPITVDSGDPSIVYLGGDIESGVPWWGEHYTGHRVREWRWGERDHVVIHHHKPPFGWIPLQNDSDVRVIAMVTGDSEVAWSLGKC